MENTVIYILGLFEEGNDPLFYNIRCFLQRNNCNVHGIELYSKNSFGSYAFDEEIGRITSEINKFRPALVVAHSLGAYVCLQLPISCPLVLLDPSIEIRKIIKSNSKQIGSKYIYDDGINKSILSKEFIRSISIAPSIQKLARYTESKH
ncbi:MAG: hypothetical protein M1320_00220, partial [Patescibacteria group bacterium]|nr:hypothetical protein [Patescibacteria group bacterium]